MASKKSVFRLRCDKRMLIGTAWGKAHVEFDYWLFRKKLLKTHMALPASNSVMQAKVRCSTQLFWSWICLTFPTCGEQFWNCVFSWKSDAQNCLQKGCQKSRRPRVHDTLREAFVGVNSASFLKPKSCFNFEGGVPDPSGIMSYQTNSSIMKSNKLDLYDKDKSRAFEPNHFGEVSESRGMIMNA